MNRVTKAAFAAMMSSAAVSANPALADTISNPQGGYNFGPLSGSLTGGQQTQFIGQTFTAPITGELTNFQFTLTSSSLQSLYGIVFAWDGSSPATELWRSETVAGTQGVIDFNPTGLSLTAGQTYVAFLSTFGLTDNSGLASVDSCLAFAGCNSNSMANLGALVSGMVFPDGSITFSQNFNAYDATFSATVTAEVPEPASWAMMIAGFGLTGGALRRYRKSETRVRFA